MTPASYKTDDGPRNPTKGFPARKLLSGRKEGAGHYLVEHRKTEEQKSRSVQKRIKENYTKYANSGADSPHYNTLDGPLLLQLHCVDDPSELCSVDISEQKLRHVKPEDLKVFDNVAYIDASVNSLSLDSFSSFACLRELNLSLNHIFTLSFDADDFSRLEVLDLSYNFLLFDNIPLIGLLPCLKVLHLTGNHLYSLPFDMTSSNDDPTQESTEEEDSRFEALEVLMLDDNKLNHLVFRSLAKLKRLKHLNLEGNYICKVTDLHGMMDCSHPEWMTAEDGLADPEANNYNKEYFQRTSQFHHKEKCGTGWIFPELQFLNVANNRISEEKSLFPLVFFPKIQEIDIHSNPLTTKRRGLTDELQQRLGVKIKSKKTPEAVKHPMKLSTDARWKVEEMIPKIPKKPLMSTDSSGLDPTQVEGREMNLKIKPASEGNNNREETSSHFFMTQVADVPENIEFELQQTEEKRNDSDVKRNPDLMEPIGIQTAVRMLQHTLNNLNVYRDSKPTVDSIQTPYKQREKRVKNLPPLEPAKPQIERVNEMIRDIRESSTKTEASLSSVIHGSCSSKQEQKEALKLLEDVKTKYKMVHKQSMEQAQTMETKPGI